MIALLWTMPVVAASVSGGVQVAAFPGALDFAGEVMTGETLYIEEPEVSGSDVACYDEVGIRNLNAIVPLNRVDLEFNDDTILVDVHFGTISGQNMDLYGVDADIWDVCPSIEATISSVEFRQGRLLAEFTVESLDDDFDIVLNAPPTLTGDLDTDIDWVPDDLVLAFVEDAILDAIEELMVDEVPPIIKSVLGNSLYTGQVGTVALDVQLEEVFLNDQLLLGMNVEAAWLGDGCPISGVISEPEGANPEVVFESARDSDLGIAITEYQINTLFFGAWEDGLLCFEAGPLFDAVEAVEATLGESIPNSDVELSFNQAPRFIIREGGMHMVLDGLHLGIYGDINGTRKALVGLDASIALEAEIRVDNALSSFVFDLSNVDLQLEALIADPLITDQNGVTARLISFLEGWAMDTLARRIANVPVYGNLFELSGLFLRIDQLAAEYGAVRVYGSLYDSTDPEVDVEAPDTDAYIAKTTPSSIHLAWSGTDDRNGTLAFSWRLNSGPWSYWTAEARGTVPTPTPGTHIVEIRSRDAWLNTDPSPKAIVFKVDERDGKPRCGCATQAPFRAGLPLLLTIILVGVRRREE